MTPIRVAIIGLSANATTDWAQRAHLPYLLSPRGRERFQIFALCNSSVAAAEKSIKVFQLPPATRAYGSPEDLAADPDVQLVVCATRVDKHYDTSMPSVKAGKDVFIEWPLAENAVRTDELLKAAEKAGGRTIVGLQGWYVPSTIKLKELITSGRLGKVQSSEFRAAGWTNDRGSLSLGLDYFGDRKVGGNLITIGFGHMFDWVQHTLGDFQTLQSHLQLQRPKLKVQDSFTGRTIKTVESDVPDLIYITGTLPANEHTSKGAILHMRHQRAPQFSGEPALVWSIVCEKGEIRLTATNSVMLQISSMADVTIDIEDWEKGTLERIPVRWTTHPDLPVVSRSFVDIYEGYASGDTTKYADFKYAHKRHTQFDGLFASFDASQAA
ncbi:hypothetical protein BKA65DRAFT_602262 [Rhexocercosporidium sp. MPI-PUGE-AT-0058]|nr:hypothetical protein BKA65DRAFT_602262 [Rhexocercosporidium sp. MPI-PUGE-AT-0058]